MDVFDSLFIREPKSLSKELPERLAALLQLTDQDVITVKYVMIHYELITLHLSIIQMARVADSIEKSVSNGDSRNELYIFSAGLKEDKNYATEEVSLTDYMPISAKLNNYR